MYDYDDEYLDEFERAGAVGPFEDDFDARAAAIERRGRTPGQPAPAQTVDARSGWWTGASEVGQVQVFQPSIDNRQTILKMNEDGPPRIHTVSLWYDYDIENELSKNFVIAAEVIAGIGGTTQSFEVDWNRGTQFSIPANTIEITAKYASTIGDSDLTVPESLVISAMVGVGSIASSSYPTRSYYTGKITNGDSRTFFIPPFATKVRFLQGSILAGANDVYNASNYVQLEAGLGSPVAEYYGNLTLMLYEGIPLGAGAKRIIFQNNSGKDLYLQAQFELDL